MLALRGYADSYPCAYRKLSDSCYDWLYTVATSIFHDGSKESRQAEKCAYAQDGYPNQVA